MKRYDVDGWDYEIYEDETGDLVEYEEAAAEIKRLKWAIRKAVSLIGINSFGAMCLLEDEIKSWEEE